MVVKCPVGICPSIENIDKKLRNQITEHKNVSSLAPAVFGSNTKEHKGGTHSS